MSASTSKTATPLVNTDDEMRQIVFAKGDKVGIPVFAPLLIVDGVSAEVVAIRMVGPAEAVKAN